MFESFINLHFELGFPVMGKAPEHRYFGLYVHSNKICDHTRISTGESGIRIPAAAAF